MFNSIEFWLILAFVGAIVLVGRRAWQSTTEMLDARREHVRAAFEEARSLGAEAQESLRRALKHRETLDAEIESLMARAIQDAEAARTALLSEAEKWRADHIRMLEQRAAGMAQDRVRSQAQRVAQLAVSAATHLIREAATPTRQRDWIASGLAQVESYFVVRSRAKITSARRRKVQ